MARRRQSSPFEHTQAPSKSRRKWSRQESPQGEPLEIPFLLDIPPDPVSSGSVAQKASDHSRSEAYAEGEAPHREDDDDDRAGDAQQGASPTRKARKPKTEEQELENVDFQDKLATLRIQQQYYAVAFKVDSSPQLNSKDTTAHGSKKALRRSRGKRSAATTALGKGRKVVKTPRKGHPHISGPCRIMPLTEPLYPMAPSVDARNGPQTAALLAVAAYGSRGFYLPRPSSPPSSSYPDRSRCIAVAPTPRYVYNTAPQWLTGAQGRAPVVDMLPLENTLPPLSTPTPTPRAMQRIFDEVDPFEVVSLVEQWVHEQSLLDVPSSTAVESFGGRPHGGAHEAPTTMRGFSNGAEDSLPTSSLSPSSNSNATSGSIDDWPGLNWPAPQGFSRGTLPLPFESGTSAPGMDPGFAYYGNWNATFAYMNGVPSWPIPDAFPIGSFNSHCTATGMTHPPGTPFNNMPPLSMSNAGSPGWQGGAIMHWYSPPIRQKSYTGAN